MKGALGRTGTGPRPLPERPPPAAPGRGRPDAALLSCPSAWGACPPTPISTLHTGNKVRQGDKETVPGAGPVLCAGEHGGEKSPQIMADHNNFEDSRPLKGDVQSPQEAGVPSDGTPRKPSQGLWILSQVSVLLSTPHPSEVPSGNMAPPPAHAAGEECWVWVRAQASWWGASSISMRKVSMGVSPMSLKKNRCSRHLRPMERRAGRRSSSLANRPCCSGYFCLQ